MRLRLYIDEDAARPGLVQGLRARKIDVITVYEAGKGGLSDEEQLLDASEEGRAIFSFNQRDFMVLHTRFLEQGLSHAGIILATQGNYEIGEQIRRLSNLVVYRSAEEMIDRVEFLGAWGNR
jgi:Domain of unknown function (DUF5615)